MLLSLVRLLRPGVVAEDVHAAYADVIQSAGHDYPFRCGRGTGFSFFENPPLVVGNKTILQQNMVFAVDGSVSADTFSAQVGDSFILNPEYAIKIYYESKSLRKQALAR